MLPVNVTLYSMHAPVNLVLFLLNINGAIYMMVNINGQVGAETVMSSTVSPDPPTFTCLCHSCSFVLSGPLRSDQPTLLF